jgi:hypothetical protein
MVYNEYLVNKAVDAGIKKYIKHYKKYGKNLDLLAKIQIDIENRFIDNVKSKNFTYQRECDEMKNILILVENRFDYYFKVNNMYNWIKGNENFRKLLVL